MIIFLLLEVLNTQLVENNCFWINKNIVMKKNFA